MRYETEAQLLEDAQRYVAHWQPLLLLQEWDIHVELVSETGLPDQDSWAENFCNTRTRDAIIRVNRDAWMKDLPAEEQKRYPFSDANRKNIEHTIIHELAHVIASDFKVFYSDITQRATKEERDNLELFEEQLLDRIASLFQRLNGRTARDVNGNKPDSSAYLPLETGL